MAIKGSNIPPGEYIHRYINHRGEERTIRITEYTPEDYKNGKVTGFLSKMQEAAKAAPKPPDAPGEADEPAADPT